MRNLIFLTVRELLFNVVKHSNVNQASVGLGPDEDGNLRVTVSDHGKGFDIKQAGKSGSGFGLATLHERLEMLGGRLQISSSPGHGVETVILAPMKQLEN